MFRDVFFFLFSKFFFESSEVSKFWCFLFWYLVVGFDLLFLIDIC